MQKIIKNTLLNFLPENIPAEKTVNPLRIYDYNDFSIRRGIIVYITERELRVNDNFALMFAVAKSKELKLPLKIIYPKVEYEVKAKNDFVNRIMGEVVKHFKKFDFEIFDGSEAEFAKYLQKLNPGFAVIDFNPITDREYLMQAEFKIFEVDGHNIIPARILSQKQEYNAATIRRKIYSQIYPFMTNFKDESRCGGEADDVCFRFINEKLPYYAEYKNNPEINVLSGLSKYLNYGFISPLRVAVEVLKSDAGRENKEAFLEELTVRSAIAENFCLYNRNFKSFEGLPEWSKTTLNNHRHDLRLYRYTANEFEGAKTHDGLWNAAQTQLLREGTIHGYLRMYWAKKIGEWSSEPREAIQTAIRLNDRYAYDAPSSHGYAGILWSIGGLHDRPFAEYPVTGKIRRMTYNSMKRKIPLGEYMKTYNSKIQSK